MAEAAASFTAMIQKDREKKKREELAQKMLGSRRSSGAGSLPTRKSLGSGPGATLASRVGVTKQLPRSGSSTPKTSIDGRWNHDLHHVNNSQTARTSSAQGTGRGNRILAGLQRELSSSNVPQSSVRKADGPSMSIRGMAAPAGPYVVVASNFALGTTAADIEAAMQPIAGEIRSCRLVASNPTVMAELVIEDKDGAENVIATFNNQKADGRLLYVYMKQGGPTPGLHPLHSSPPSAPTPAPKESPAPPPAEEEPAVYEAPAPIPSVVRDLMDVDDETAVPRGPTPRDNRYSDRDRYRDDGYRGSYRNGREAYRDSFNRQDYSRGYGRDRAPRGLYSDSMYRGDAGYRR